MKRTLSFMVMVLALLLTQCRKPEVKFPTPSATEGVTVSMTVTAGPGSKTNIDADGRITWSSGDKLYVGDGSKCIGCLTLTSGADNPTGTFSGNVTLTKDTRGEQTFHFYYLGRAERTLENDGTSVEVSFAEQTGLRENLGSCHVGYGSAAGTVAGSEVTGINVTLVSKVALARFSFKKGGTGYSKALTLSGTHIYNKMTVNFDSEGFSCTGTEGNISLTNTMSSEKYVMLVPVGTESETLSFAGEGFDGSTTLGSGIEPNKFYGREVAIEVKPVEFTVNKDNGTTVEFAPGNLYYNGADDSNKVNSNLPSGWNFYEHQWDCYAEGTKEVTESMEINLFTWGYGEWSTVYNTTTYQTGNTMTDWGTAPGLPSAGEGKKWRTLTDDEWKNLLGISGGRSLRDNAASLRALVTLDNGVKGLVILPDGSTVTASSVTTTALVASSGAVFLPAAGLRSGTTVGSVGSEGDYWSSAALGSSSTYRLNFKSDDVNTSFFFRSFGNAVRLVRE